MRPCPHEEGEIILNIFLRPKKDGLLNLKNLNQFPEYKHFNPSYTKLFRTHTLYQGEGSYPDPHNYLINTY